MSNALRDVSKPTLTKSINEWIHNKNRKNGGKSHQIKDKQSLNKLEFTKDLLSKPKHSEWIDLLIHI